MKIYYLSATGNSLVTARRLARELDEDVTLESFRSIRLLPEIETGDTAVGFVFPVYFADVPREFLACIQRMKFRRNTYLFAIATCNGVPGTTLRTLSGALALIADRTHDRTQGANLYSPNSGVGKPSLRGSARHRPPFCGEYPKISHGGDGLHWLWPLRAGLPGLKHHHLQQSRPLGFQLHTLSGLFPLVSQTGDTHRRLTHRPPQIPSPRSISLRSLLTFADHAALRPAAPVPGCMIRFPFA